MTCREFRRQFQAFLDARKASVLSAHCEEHGSTCASCASYARSMLQLDADLAHLPEVDLPESLIHLAGSIESAEAARPSWRPYIIKGVVISAAAAIGLALSSQLGPVGAQLVRMALVSAGFFMVLVTSLRPYCVSDDSANQTTP